MLYHRQESLQGTVCWSKVLDCRGRGHWNKAYTCILLTEKTGKLSFKYLCLYPWICAILTIGQRSFFLNRQRWVIIECSALDRTLIWPHPKHRRHWRRKWIECHSRGRVEYYKILSSGHGIAALYGRYVYLQKTCSRLDLSAFYNEWEMRPWDPTHFWKIIGII